MDLKNDRKKVMTITKKTGTLNSGFNNTIVYFFCCLKINNVGSKVNAFTVE